MVLDERVGGTLASRARGDFTRPNATNLLVGNDGQGDCVVLPAEGSYPSAESMGIQNDSISSIHNKSARKVRGFWHTSFSLLGVEVAPHANTDNLDKGGWITKGINDNISSVQVL